MSEQRAEWSNKLVFILAAAGSAIGLGNIWRFPYMTGENGGAAFVVIYMICLFAIALPIMVAELSIGRASKLSPILAFKQLGRKFGKYWQIVGWMGVIAAFILVSFYSVIGGWTIAYIFKSFSLASTELTKDTAIASFEAFCNNGYEQVFYTLLFIGLGVGIVIRGIKEGLEKFNTIFMPGLFIMLIILVVNALLCDGCEEGLNFLFYPDFSKVNSEVILAAVGQAFFSLSVGMGAILTYGSYLHQKEDLIKTSSIIATLLVAVALLAGIAIFPVVFSAGMEPASGPGLTFITLPVAFLRFGALGPFLGVVFFLMLLVAALTSVISIIEPVVSHLVDKGLCNRKIGTLAVGAGAALLAIPSALSFKTTGFTFFSDKIFLNRNFFEFAEFIVCDNVLPLGGISMALFVLFVVARKIRHQQVSSFYTAWKYLLPVSALAVIIVYLNKSFSNPVWFGISIIILVALGAMVFVTRYKSPEDEHADEDEEKVA